MVVSYVQLSRGEVDKLQLLNQIQLAARFFFVKVYWSKATPIHLHIAYGCSPDITAELSGYKRAVGPQRLKYLLLAFYRKSLLTSE